MGVCGRTGHRPATIVRRAAAEERGIALVMALGFLFVLTLLFATVVFVTTAGSQDAEAKNAGQKAYALAEAGLNSAFAQLAPHYPSSTPGDSSWLASPGPQSYGGGTANYSGSYDGATKTWT